MGPPPPTTLMEHCVAISIGGLLLVVAVSIWGWGIRLAVAGGQAPAGWPPGMEKLLFPLGLLALAVGFGSWRMLLISLPNGIAGFSLGKWVLALFVLAGLIGGLG